MKAGVLPATGLFQTAVFWAGLLFYAGLLFCGGAEFFLQGAASDDSVASRVEATVMCPAFFPVLSEILALEENGWPSLISGSPGQDALASGEDSLECRQHTLPCRAFNSFEVSLKYPVRSSGKVAWCDETLPMFPSTDETAQSDDRMNRTIHFASSCCEIDGRDCPDLFGQRWACISQCIAINYLSTAIHFSSAPLKYLKIYKTLPSPSTGVFSDSSPSIDAWATSDLSVSQATWSIILPLSFSGFWISSSISVTSEFSSISVLSSPSGIPPLSSSPGISVQSILPKTQITFLISASPAFKIIIVNISFLNISSSREMDKILEYSKSFRFMLYHTSLVHTSFPVFIVPLPNYHSTVSQSYFIFPVFSNILDNNLFTACQSSQQYPAKDVNVVFLRIPVYTSIAGSYYIVCFVAMDRWEEGMGVRMGWLVGNLLPQEPCESPDQLPLDIADFCRGAPVSSDGHQSLTNGADTAIELNRHSQGWPGLNRSLNLDSGYKIILFGSLTADYFIIMTCNIWWNLRVTGPNSLGDTGQIFMDKINYGSSLFNKRVNVQFGTVNSFFEHLKIFDNNTTKLVAEMQVLAPPAKPLYERSPIHADTRLFRDLLTERLNTEFWETCLTSAKIVKIPDVSQILALSRYISEAEGNLDDNLIKLVSTSGPLNQALQNAIFETHRDLVTYDTFVDPTIDYFESLPETLTLSTWQDELDALKQKSRNVSITHNSNGTLSVDSFKSVQILPDSFSQTLSKQIFQRRREHITWFALYPKIDVDFIFLKEFSVNKIFDKIALGFKNFRLVTGNSSYDQEFSNMIDRYVSVSQDVFGALGSWLILSASNLPKVLHPSRILQLWDIISVSSGDENIKRAVDPLTPGDIYCVNRTDLGSDSLVYTLGHE
jgi:hypothetical protein